MAVSETHTCCSANRQNFSYSMRKGGFSLIELIIVILILVIISIFVALRSPDLNIIRTAQAAYKLKSDIRFAQSYAVASRKRSRVAFDRGANSYSVFTEPSLGSWINMTNPLTKQSFVVNFGQGDYTGVSITQVDFGGEDNDLVFDASGIPYGYSGGSATALSANGTVVLSGGENKTIIVIPQTGMVSIQ